MIRKELNNEAALFQLVSEGDAAAFQVIFHHYNALLYPFVVKLTGSGEMAKEAIQDIFLRVWQQRQKLAGIQNHNAWFYRVASNTAINYLRRQAAAGRLFDALKTQSLPIAATPESMLLVRETARLIHQAVQSLPPAQQQVYRMSREQYKTIPEIAEVQGVSPNTVKNQLVTALKAIKTYLEKGLYLLLAACCIFFIIFFVNG